MNDHHNMEQEEERNTEIGPSNRVSVATLAAVVSASILAAGWGWRIESKIDNVHVMMTDRWTATDMHVWSMTLRERNKGKELVVPTIEEARHK